MYFEFYSADVLNFVHVHCSEGYFMESWEMVRRCYTCENGKASDMERPFIWKWFIEKRY
jgi:hypothetical protein